MDLMFSVNSDKFKPRQDNLPRILLRGWHPGTAASALGLNTGSGIYPFAWQCTAPASNKLVSRDPPNLPVRLHELSKIAVKALASEHIAGEEDVATPFTSWTADFSTSAFFGMGSPALSSAGEVQWEMHGAPGYIAVMDSSRPRPVIHVPDLGWASLPQEYLVYGPVIQGLRVVSIATIRKTLNCIHWPNCHSVRGEAHPVTEEEIRDSVRVGLLFQGPADNNVDVAMVVAASLLSWAQVPVSTPRPLEPEDLVQAERQQVRPWPEEDVGAILSSRLLVHKGAVPPLSGAVLGNALTSTVGAPQLELTIQLLTRMQSAWGPAAETGPTAEADPAAETGPAAEAGSAAETGPAAETSPPVLTRAQWVAAFKAAANRLAPTPHDCGPIRCEFCGKVHPGDTATGWLRFEFIYFCSQECQISQAKKEKVERGAASL